jgi:hypothetical protein
MYFRLHHLKQHRTPVRLAELRWACDFCISDYRWHLLRAGRAVMTGKLAVTKETSLQVQIQFAPESKVPVEALGELC